MSFLFLTLFVVVALLVWGALFFPLALVESLNLPYWLWLSLLALIFSWAIGD